MIYHDLEELNKIIFEMNDICSDNGILLGIYPRVDYFCYTMNDAYNEEFLCGKGIIYKYEKHNNPFLKELDRLIVKSDRKNLNYVKDRKYKYGDIMIRNEYLCYDCNKCDNFYVCKSDDFLDVFCMHNDYIKDEIMIVIDE